MKGYFLFLFVSCIVNCAFPQAPYWAWATATGGVEGRAASTDADENIYLAGNLGIGTDSFGNGVITCIGGINGCAFLAKFDSSGNFIWAKGESSPGSGYAISRAVAADDNGYVYVAGDFTDTIVFDSDTIKSTIGGVFIVKYDSFGNVIWAKGYPSIAVKSMATDSTGKIYVTGAFTVTVTLGAYTLVNLGSLDCYNMKCDTSGNVMWANEAGGSAMDYAWGIAVDPSANSYITGELASSSISFGSTTLLNPGTGGVPFIAKYDSSGNFKWVRIGNVPLFSNSGWSVSADRFYHIYLGGFFYNPSIAFDTITLTKSGGGSNAFLVRYDTAGNVLWARSAIAIGTGNVGTRSVTTDPCGRVYLGGWYVEGGVFDSTSVMVDTILINCSTCVGAIPDRDPIFIAGYDSLGNVFFAKGLSSGGDDEYQLVTGPSGALYLGGDYLSMGQPFIIGNDTFPAGGEVPFLARLNVPACTMQTPVAGLSAPNQICPGTCTDFLNLSLNAISYEWNFQGAIPDTSTVDNPSNICYSTPGSYNVQLIATNANGSDTLTLNNYITVYPTPPPQSITQSGDTLLAIPGSAIYQWYFNNNIINGATNYFYVAQSSGDYNVVATDSNGCEVEAAIFNVLAGLTPALTNGQGVMVFPNPVLDKFTIHDLVPMAIGITRGPAVDISIYNVLGEKILLDVDYRLGTVDCRLLNPGIYYIEINSRGKIFRSKFVKQ